MAEFISNVAMIAALYFIVAIVLPKKIMFFFPENLQKRKYAILGMFVAFILGAIAYSNTDEGMTASSNAEKEQKESIAGSKEWYDKLISVASRDSAQLSRFKVLDEEINKADVNGIGFYVNQYDNYKTYDNGVDSMKQYFDANERLSSLRHYCVKRRAEIMDEAKPKLRKRYIKTLGDKLWEDDIKVKGNGKTITFIGGVFAANRNIKDFEDKIEDTLKKLGFKRVIYKWVDADVEYTYYDL